MERFFSLILGRWGKFASVIELGRPWNGIAVGLLSVVGAMLALKSIPPTSLLVITGFETLIIYMAASILNDVYDIDVDRVNMPYRPIQRGKIKMEIALYSSFAFYIVGIIISILVSLNFFFAVLLMSALSMIYSIPPIEAKNRGFLGNIVLGFDMIFTSTYAGYVIVTNTLIPNFEFLISVSIFTISFIFLSIVKDFKDVYGDKIYNKKTSALKYSKKFLTLLIMFGTFLLFLTTILFNTYFFHSTLFIFISFVVFTILFTVNLSLYNRISVEVGEIVWGAERILVLILILNMFLFSLISFT
jgi:4-hydroxybenzoate polyprenyltransferase